MEKLKINESMQDRPKHLSDAFNDTFINARDRVYAVSKDAAQKVDQSAHQNPWAYVGGAALASAVAGFFLGRKTKE